MADVFKTIFEMDGQGSSVLAELDAIKSKYTGINTTMRGQQAELDRLITINKRLADAQRNATNPTQMVFYKNEIKKNADQIAILRGELEKTGATEKKVGDDAATMKGKLDKAFSTTTVNALNTSLKQVEKQIKETVEVPEIQKLRGQLSELREGIIAVGSESELGKQLTVDAKNLQARIKELEGEYENLDATIAGENISDGFADAEEKTVSLKAQLRALKAELANATDPAEIERLAKAAGELQDKLDAANEATAIFAAGDPSEQFANGLGDVAGKIANLDFSGALDQARLLVTVSKQMTFGNALKGIKDLGLALLNVGKALLTNPLFLIAGVIAAVVLNFDKLTKIKGPIGDFFRGIGDAISFVTGLFTELTDWIGLTHDALDRLNTAKIQSLAGKLEDDIKTLDRYSKALKAAGKDVEATEKAKQEAIITSSRKQLALLDEIIAAEYEASDEQKEARQKLVDAILDAENERYVIETDGARRRKEKAKKDAEDRFKIFEDARKKLNDLATKDEQFNIDFRMSEGSQEQIKRAYALRKSLEEQELKEYEATKIKELKAANATAEQIAKFREQVQLASIVTELNREQELQKDLVNARIKLANDAAARIRDNNNKLTDQYKADQNASEYFVALRRLEIQKEYYKAVIAAAEKDVADRKALGLDTLNAEKALYDLRLQAATDYSTAQDELNKIELADRIASIDAELEHVQSKNRRLNTLQSTRTRTELLAERSRLAALIASGEAEVDAVRASKDRILELEKQSKRERIAEVLDFTQQFVTATIQATEQVLASKQKEVEGLIALQEKRVDEVKDIAEKGNAEMLEEEKKRLDNLNKEREKYVRQQQALAVVELIANTAITVSKAAAEGGVAAGVTIAAALLALVGGLVAARNIASQAAYYEGGYTGDGNPREQSHTMGGRRTQRNYVWHKGEFVFDHIKTRENRGLFQDIHEGRINLKDLKAKADMFDDMRTYEFDKHAEIFLKPVTNNNSDFSKLESRMEEMIHAVQNQERMFLQINERGWMARLDGIRDRDKMIRDFAK